MGFTDMQREAPALALEWRMQTREIFETYFAPRATARSTSSSTARARGRYLLAKPVGNRRCRRGSRSVAPYAGWYN